MTLSIAPTIALQLKKFLMRFISWYTCLLFWLIRCLKRISLGPNFLPSQVQAMPSPELGPGEDWQKQFRKVVVSAGPLKGARYPEVSWEDLRRAAKSYKQDPRFCQYAKRMMSEKALGSRPAQPQTASRTWRKMGAEWLMWGLAKAKGKAVLFTFLALLACMLISRPLFYVVMAKSLTMGIRLVLRGSFGLVIIVIDATLDEVAANLEASLLTQPPCLREHRLNIPCMLLRSNSTTPLVQSCFI